jgi:Zn-dependent peptidase ImmA (M78 family)
MPRDHYVGFRSEETIAQLAARLRDTHGSRSDSTFDIIDFVEQTLPKHLSSTKKALLKLEFYDKEFEQDDPAYVTFDPLTLHVDRTIWTDAKIGDEYARFVIAHEVGHIVLHDHSAKGFSSDRSAQIRFADDGQSAEWQANTFAGHFLAPDSVVEKFRDVTMIAAYCQIPDRLALDRVLALKRKERRKSRIFQGDFCTNCGNFSLVCSGTTFKCATFGCEKIISRL